MAFTRTILTCALLLPLLGCQEKPLPKGTWALGADEVWARLDRSDFADFMQNRQCGIFIRISHTGVRPKALNWTITSEGQFMLSFGVEITPLDATHSKVEITVRRDSSDATEAYDGKHFYTRPAVSQPVRPAIEEQIAALLTGKPFNAERLWAGQPRDSVCNVQRAGMESGIRFRWNDKADEYDRHLSR